eukprot:CAMPEP_0204556572 /NCGR_PEP_ID=MMETSP0661-20131031/29684_1 /ASSEMBLY_ACC=CAM_ASM_000606 /TAXON_ID=109239 /ORGANISM="Alexandrium margalefi, Strain AMGDE01CS-322" /LENGTH=266 /DNA_ID=CAMNT_0051563683 /DNA_START=44 /DNA_END=844 /DNA_ORIENTATION=+
MVNDARISVVALAMVPGVAQAVTVTAVGFPFDTIKARMQTGMYPGGSMACLSATLKREGPLALYRGASTPLLSHVLKRSYQFPLFDYLTEGLHWNSFLAGLFSGGTGSLLGTPLQVIKINAQTSTRDQHRNAFTFMRERIRQKGVLSLWRGLSASLAKDSSFGCVFMGSYNMLRKRLVGNETYWKRFFNGATAHVITWGLLMPVDFVKTGVQRSEVPITPVTYTRQMLQTHGLLHFWKGSVPACIRAVPVSGFGMLAYEAAKSCVL